MSLGFKRLAMNCPMNVKFKIHRKIFSYTFTLETCTKLLRQIPILIKIRLKPTHSYENPCCYSSLKLGRTAFSATY